LVYDVVPMTSNPSTAIPSAPNSRLIPPEWYLIGVVIVWSLSFSLMKRWQDAAQLWAGDDFLLQSQASFALMTVRMGLASLCFIAAKPRVALAPDRRAWLAGTCVGLCMWSGLALQLLGLALTSPAMSAFFTSLASFFAPMILLFMGVRQNRLLWIGLAVAMVGGVVMVEGGWKFGPGEALTVLSAVFFATQVVVLDRMGGELVAHRLTLAFFTVNTLASALSLAVLVIWRGNGAEFIGWLSAMLGQPTVLFDLLLLLVFPTLIGFGWMNRYQPLVGAGRAALIYLLEPVFATAFSVAYQHEGLTWHLVTGGLLVLGGNLLGEWGRAAKPNPPECT